MSFCEGQDSGLPIPDAARYVQTPEGFDRALVDADCGAGQAGDSEGGGTFHLSSGYTKFPRPLPPSVSSAHLFHRDVQFK